MLLEELSIDAEKLVRDATIECGYDIPFPKMGADSKEIMKFAIDFVKNNHDDMAATAMGAGSALATTLMALATSTNSKRASATEPSSYWSSAMRRRIEEYGFHELPSIAELYADDSERGVYPRAAIRRLAMKGRHAIDYVLQLLYYSRAQPGHRAVGDYERSIARAACKQLGLINAVK